MLHLNYLQHTGKTTRNIKNRSCCKKLHKYHSQTSKKMRKNKLFILGMKIKLCRMVCFCSWWKCSNEMYLSYTFIDELVMIVKKQKNRFYIDITMFFQAKQRLKIKERLCPGLHHALMLRFLKHTTTFMMETVKKFEMVKMTCTIMATRYQLFLVVSA